MSAAKRTRPVRAGLAALRRRLREAEDTLAAIRDGHVDALIVRSDGEDAIYTLKTADHPYRLMVEQMREGAVNLADDGTVLYCNRRFAELVNLPSERITGRSFRDFLVDADRARFLGALATQSFRDEFRLDVGPDRAVHVQLSATGLVIDGVRTVAVVVSDLTHERSERALRESNRLKDEFLATLSHELRTPLNVILGWTNILLAGRETAGSRRHALTLIDRNARAQARIVSDLVDMSRMVTGKMRLDLQPVRVSTLMEGAVDAARPAADAKGVTLTATWHDSDVHAYADPTRIQQVVWNLLSNAVKFTPVGGTVHVSSRQTGDRAVALEVADSGIGIDPAFLPYVFDRFRQEESGTTRGYGGLGLGLAIVNDLVRLHGGTVEVHSPGAGLGATFVVTLPTATRPPAPMAAPARRRRVLRKGTRILIVEDHDDSRALAVEMIREAGGSPVAVASAAAAMHVLTTSRVAALVADIGLPGGDGWSLVQELRSHRLARLRELPAIAVTAYTSTIDREQALTMGFQEHVPKPVDSRLLIAALERALA